MKSPEQILPVLAWIGDKTEKMFLSYDLAGPLLVNENGTSSFRDLILEIKTDVVVDKQNASVRVTRNAPFRISLQPIIRSVRKYIPDGNKPDSLYPPSSEGWLGRIDKSGRDSLFYVHEILDEKAFWLIIIDCDTFRIYEAHPIRQFEAEMLRLTNEFEEYTVALEATQNYDESIEWMNSILSDEPPTWNELARIVKNVYIPNLRLGNNMRETMEQLVPSEYDHEVRNQIMAFLALVTKWSYPDDDPVDYFNRIFPLELLYTLLQGYLTCELSGEEIPDYVRIFQESVLHRLGGPTRPLWDAYRETPWNIAHYRIMESIPNALGASMRWAAELNESQKVLVGLPVTKKEAARSKAAWKDRFLLMAAGFRIRTHLRPQGIGLVRLIDITRAHQWPHRHMKWSASIGGGGYKEPHIQMMEMPSSAVSKVISARPNVVETNWSTTAMNAKLFSESGNQWRVSVTRIANSLKGARTLRKLENEFGVLKRKKIHSPTLLWARCLDLTANLGYLASLENPGFLNQMNLSDSKLLEALNELQERTITSLVYMPVFRDLVSTVIIAQGDPSILFSLARGFLKHTPTATVNLGRNSQWLLVLTRLPAYAAQQISTDLPEQASKQGITLTCHRVISFRSYSWKFYQRILKDDGSWDDDVSAMLSQIRLPPPEDNP